MQNTPGMASHGGPMLPLRGERNRSPGVATPQGQLVADAAQQSITHVILITQFTMSTYFANLTHIDKFGGNLAENRPSHHFSGGIADCLKWPVVWIKAMRTGHEAGSNAIAHGDRCDRRRGPVAAAGTSSSRAPSVRQPCSFGLRWRACPPTGRELAFGTRRALITRLLAADCRPLRTVPAVQDILTQAPLTTRVKSC